MSAQIEYNQMPSEPAPAVLSEQKFSVEQPVSFQLSLVRQLSRDDGALCSMPSCSPPPSAPRQLHFNISMILRTRTDRQ
ncbi:hypothetical protein LY78DRAFT_660667 [Colletotrichum sublineola]|nr:hypothetical protein LY78DRAFT_660667 [Colletotrichum sublineola]